MQNSDLSVPPSSISPSIYTTAKIGCPIVGLARRLGFHEDGLAFEFIEGGWYIVSTARFEQETGYAVGSFGGTFPGGLPILSDVSWDGTPLHRP